MARPTKLTPSVEREILTSLRAGMTRTAAFESVGVDRSQCARWMTRFAAFRVAVLQAEAQAEIRATITVRQAAESDPKYALAWLERRRPADWSPRAQLTVEIRQAAEAIAAKTGADADWLVKRAIEIASGNGAL